MINPKQIKKQIHWDSKWDDYLIIRSQCFEIHVAFPLILNHNKGEDKNQMNLD